MKQGRAAFAFVFVTVLLDMLALGITVPVLPKLIIQFEHGNIADAASATGLFAFVRASMQFVFSPVIGVLSDHYGRRPVILLSNLGLGLDYVLMALAPSLGWLFVGRAISGITASSFPTASAYVADVTPPEERAAKFGMLRGIVWSRLHFRTGAWRISWRHGPALPILGSRVAQHRQFRSRLFHSSRIAAAG